MSFFRLNSWLFFLGIACASLCACVVEGAQGAAKDAPQDDALASPSEQLTLKVVQQREQQAKQTIDLDEAARAEIANLYKQAVDQMKLAQRWAEDTAKFDALRQKAPDTLRQVRATLDQPPEPFVPHIPSGVDIVDLEQRLLQVRSELDEVRQNEASRVEQKRRRNERRFKIPRLISAAKQRLDQLRQSQEASPATDQPSPIELARQTLFEAQQNAVEQEIEAYQMESRSYDVRGELLQARLDEAARHVTDAEEQVAAWRKVLDKRRREEAQKAIDEARKAIAEVDPVLKPLAERNAELTRMRVELNQAIEQTTIATGQSRDRLRTLKQEFEHIQERISVAGLTDAISRALRKHRDELPTISQLENKIRKHKTNIANAQLRLMNLEDRYASSADAVPTLKSLLAPLDPSTSAKGRSAIESKAKELLKTERKYFGELVRDYDSFLAKLIELDGAEHEMIDRIRQYTDYVNTNILWIKSSAVLQTADMQKSWAALRWLADPKRWISSVRSISGTVQAKPLVLAIFVFLLAALLVLRVQWSRWVTRFVKGSQAPDSLLYASAALTVAVLPAAFWFGLFWLVAWLLVSPYESTGFAKALAHGLRSAAIIYFLIEINRQLTREGGLGDHYLRWRAASRQLVHRNTLWLGIVLVPSFLIFSTLDWQTDETYKDSLGRVVFILAYLSLAVFTQRILRPGGDLLRNVLQRKQGGWLYQLRSLWYPLAVATPAGLAVAAGSGYYYTAMYLGWRLVATFALFLGLLILASLLLRWLQLRVRRRAIEEARARKAAEARLDEKSGAEGITIAANEPMLDVSSLTSQTRHLVRMAALFGAAIGIWFIWAEALPALGVFERFTLWTITAETSEAITQPDGQVVNQTLAQTVPITLAEAGLAVLMLVVTIVAARNLPGLLEITVLERLPLSPSGRYATAAILMYLITAVGIVLAFNTIGIGWSKVQWLVAAITVGLGFGLQEIFANFFSGLIILFERPIRVGDVVTVDGISGIVSRIRIRATTITSWERKELVVPNKRFITGNFLNWTLSDNKIRIDIPIAISRDSDIGLAREVLLKVAGDNPTILPDPPPNVFLTKLGATSLEFELRVFIRRADYGQVLDAVNAAIEHQLKAAGIAIVA